MKEEKKCLGKSFNTNLKQQFVFSDFSNKTQYVITDNIVKRSLSQIFSKQMLRLSGRMAKVLFFESASTGVDSRMRRQ